MKRPVLILGAGSDIALALAHRFAAAQYPIQLAARDPQLLESDQRDIELRHGVAVSSHQFDALGADAMAGLLAELSPIPGTVVCAVGYLGDQQACESTPSEACLTVNSNFVGPTRALEQAAARLASLDEATYIVGISSVAGDRGRAKNYWYGAAKAGFTAALSGMRQKYAGTGVHVVTVKPGFVATRMTEELDLPEFLTDTPQHIAKLIVEGLPKGRRVIVPLKWRLIMWVLVVLPERIFERLRF